MSNKPPRALNLPDGYFDWPPSKQRDWAEEYLRQLVNPSPVGADKTSEEE